MDIKVFGTPFDVLLDYDQEEDPTRKVPVIIEQCLRYIFAEGVAQGVTGLFKNAGSGPEVSELEQVLENGDDIDFTTIKDKHSVPSLLKLYLRKAPDCLMVSGNFDRWMSVAEEDIEDMPRAAHDLIQTLPRANRAILGELMKLLATIDVNSEHTGMESESLAQLLSPYLLFKPDRSALEMEQTVRLNDLVAVMIEEYEMLFEETEVDRLCGERAALDCAYFKRKLVGHQKSITALCASWDGKEIWSADSSGAIRIWDASHFAFAKEISTEQGRIFALKCDGKNMWCASERGLQIRNENGILQKSVPGTVLAIAVVPGVGVWVSTEAALVVYTLTQEKVHEIPTGAAIVVAMEYARGHVWCGGNDKALRVYDAKTYSLMKTLTVHRRKVNAVIAWDDRVYSAGDDRLICCWDTESLQLVRKVRRHQGRIHHLASFGSHLWSASWDKSVLVWDRDLRLAASLRGFHRDAVSSVLAHYNIPRAMWVGWTGSWDMSLCVFGVPCCNLPRPEDAEADGAGSAAGAGGDGEDGEGLGLSRFASDEGLLESLAVGGSARHRPRTSMMGNSRMQASRAASRAARRDEEEADSLSKWEIDPDEITDPGGTLGTGSFGTVFTARLKGKLVAVKKLSTQKFDEKTLEDFKKEVAIMSTLRHPNVLLFMGATTKPGNLLIVTELMPKGSVYDLLRNPRIQLSFKRKMVFAKDAALGVNWLHRSKPQFLHLDLKAANLLVDENWRVKVADFGLSVVKSHSAKDKERHGPIGTPLWMAPEVLLNKEYNEKADTYSFAICLWEMLTGEDPWDEIESLVQLVETVCMQHRRPVLPKNIPTSLMTLIHGCWDKNPDHRPTFEEIIPQFDNIIIDGIIADPLGRAMWRQNFLGKLSISWKEFVLAFTKITRTRIPTDPKDIKFQCLRAVLCPEDKEQVTIENFAKLLEWFGPLNTPGIIDRIYLLVKEPYFHGDITSLEAEKVMEGKKKGTFLLRFSAREPGGYALTVLNAKGSLKHFRISHVPGSPYTIGKVKADKLETLIKRYSRELGLNLKRPCEGSKYRSMILIHEKNQITLGYMEV